jgi:hypothetical protein
MESYTYRVIRYVHDPAVGETLNVGVLLYAPSIRYLGFRLEPLYERLSTTFANFNGENYRKYLHHLEIVLHQWAERMQPNLGLYEVPKDLMALSRLVWPDMGGSFQPGPILAGITSDPDAELEALFERMVASQYKREMKTRRTDDEVWIQYQRRLPVEVRQQLRAKTFETNEFEATFEHTFKNGLWNVLEPVSLDYSNPQSIQKKAVDLLGSAVALESHPELGTFYLLLGAPQNDSYRTRYNRAKDLLNKMPVAKRLIEEDEANDFAEYLASYMREQGLVPASAKAFGAEEGSGS